MNPTLLLLPLALLPASFLGCADEDLTLSGRPDGPVEGEISSGPWEGPLPGDPATTPDPERPGFFTYDDPASAPEPDFILVDGDLFVPPDVYYAEIAVSPEKSLTKYSLSFTKGASKPLSTLASYDCNYTYSGSVYFSTLWGDNEDGGKTCSSQKASDSTGFNSSLCNSYDAITGSTCNGEFCGRHPGVDVAGMSGATVYAIGAGTIYGTPTTSCVKGSTSCGNGWGNNVIVRHTAKDATSASNTYIYSIYAHLVSVSSSVATSGTSVSAGTTLGKTGSTGNSTGEHLHYQIDRHTREGTSTTFSHPYWPSSGAPNTPDWDGSDVYEYTYSPLTAIGYGSCY